MLELLSVVVALAIAAWAVAAFHLRGEDLSAFDRPPGQSFARAKAPSEEHRRLAKMLSEGFIALRQGSPKTRLLAMRDYMNAMFADRELVSSFVETSVDGLAAEWVVAPGAASTRRLLYLHGGAFTMGSPRSHRVLTSKFSEIANAAVLAIDYRLMPENSRMAGIEDCRAAYRWLLGNGPQGKQPAEKVFVAGDSAGGNLALSLIAWVRDQGIRQADAVVAMSPVTDATFSAPSVVNNIETDVMLGPQFGALRKVPKTVLLWITWITTRINPSDPLVSPVFGDLSNLPPVLLHASEAEMMVDDCRRYVNKAVAAGSPAKLQTWAHVAHAWHIFEPELAEAREALEEIRKFIAAQEN